MNSCIIVLRDRNQIKVLDISIDFIRKFVVIVIIWKRVGIPDGWIQYKRNKEEETEDTDNTEGPKEEAEETVIP